MSQLKVNSIVPVGGLPSGANGGIIQTVQTSKTDTASTTSNSLSDLMTATITPSSSSNKILLLCDLKLGASSNSPDPQINFFRNSTQIYLGDTDGNRDRTMYGSDEFGSASAIQYVVRCIQGHFLDSPATTSAITYKIQWRIGQASNGTLYLNRQGADSNTNHYARSASSFTLMEVSA